MTPPKLNAVQRRAFEAMEENKWYDRYDFGFGKEIDIINQLVQLGFVEHKAQKARRKTQKEIIDHAYTFHQTGEVSH